MAEHTDAEIQALYDRVIAVLEGHPASLQATVLANVTASFAMAHMTNGPDPYDTARLIYRNSKLHIARNLAGQGMTTKLPKGATRQ